MALDLLFAHFDELIRTPEDVQRLNEAILQLAVQGKLVAQDPNDEPASELLKRMEAENEQLAHESKTRGLKPSGILNSDNAPNVLPESWQWCDIRALFQVISTRGKQLNTKNYLEEGKYPIVSQGQSLVEGYSDDVDKVIFLDDPVIVFGDHTRQVKYVDFDFIAGADGTKILAPYRPIYPKYFYYALRSFTVDQRGYARHFKLLKNAPFPLPPLAEQHRIVGTIETLLAQTRTLEAKLRQAQKDIVTVNRAALNRLHTAQDEDQFQAAWRTIRDQFDVLYDNPRNVAELRQTILDLAVRGKLVPQDPNDEPAEELLRNIGGARSRENGKKKSLKSTRVSVRSDTPYDVPASWEWAQFFEVANIATNSTDPGLYPDLPHIAPDNIEKFTGRLLVYRTVAEDGVSSVNHRFFAGQILYSKIRPNLSKAVLIDFEGLCSADMYPIQPSIDPRYLHLYILSSVFLSTVTRTDTRVAMPKINQEALSKVPVAVPPLAEQQRIVAKVDQLMRLCDELEAGLAQQEVTQNRCTSAIVFASIRKVG